MSVLATAATDPSTHLLAESILEWVNDKGAATNSALQTWTLILAGGSVLVVAIMSRMALGKVMGTALVAGLVCGVVFNMDALKDKSGEELETVGFGTPPAVVTVVHEV